MQDINDMVIFAKVIDQGGFTAAEEVVGLPKSNLSRRVARLEDRLGVRLLERTTRRLNLTENGQIYYYHCKRIMDEAEQADSSVSKLMQTPKGILKVSASMTTGQFLLAPYLDAYMEKYPDVQVQLNLSNRKIDLLEEGFDLAVRVGKIRDVGLIARSLGKSQSYLYASPKYLMQYGVPEHPEDLHQHKCLKIGDMEKSLPWRLSCNNNELNIAIQPDVAVNDYNVLKQLVISGQGIAVIPDYMCKDCHEGQLVKVLENWLAPAIEFYALFPRHRGATPKVRSFINFLIENVGEKLLLKNE